MLLTREFTVDKYSRAHAKLFIEMAHHLAFLVNNSEN
jgi:hypothetical protein